MLKIARPAFINKFLTSDPALNINPPINLAGPKKSFLPKLNTFLVNPGKTVVKVIIANFKRFRGF